MTDTQQHYEPPTVAGSDFSGDQHATTLGGAVRDYVDRLRGGDMGALPAILGLVILFIVFRALSPEFTSALNIANLLVQAGAISVLAMGLVPVLLLGDIDLSAGVAGGSAAGVMAVLINDHGWGWVTAVLAAIVTGLVIGTAIGLLVSKVGIPSFVVTLAFFLGLQGVTLKLIGQGGTVPVRNNVIIAIANKNMSVAFGWVVAVAVVLVFAALTLLRYRTQVARNLQHQPMAVIALQILGLAVIVLGMTALLSKNRANNPLLVTLAGVPWVVPLVGVLLVFWTFIFGRTAYGRHVYATGGNKEAARRAGIRVDRIRISVFAICSSMAALSGIVAASRLNSVTPDAGAGNTLLYAVGAAVIGGTSLFGGRGKIRDAVIGGLVIATIDNGLGLQGYDAYIKYIVTGGVLLLAASVDALSRRRRSVTGT